MTSDSDPKTEINRAQLDLLIKFQEFQKVEKDKVLIDLKKEPQNRLRVMDKVNRLFPMDKERRLKSFYKRVKETKVSLSIKEIDSILKMKKRLNI